MKKDQNINPGMALKAYRIKEGLKQTDLAKLLQCTQGFIALVEKGDRAPDPITAGTWEVLTGGKLKREVLRPDVFL